MKTSNGTLNYKGIKLEIEYEYSPVVKGKWTLSNGDPGYPDEGGEFNIYSICHEGDDIMELLSESTIRKIEEIYCQQVEAC